MAKMEKLVLKVSKACLVHQVPWETRDQLVNLAKMDSLELKEILVHEETQEKMVHPEFLVHLVLLDLWVKEEHQVRQEQEDSKECLEQLANLVSLGKMAWLDFLVNLV